MNCFLMAWKPCNSPSQQKLCAIRESLAYCATLVVSDPVPNRHPKSFGTGKGLGGSLSVNKESDAAKQIWADRLGARDMLKAAKESFGFVATCLVSK